MEVKIGVQQAPRELVVESGQTSAEIAARSWLTSGRKVPKPEAVALVAALNWRGIAGFPMQAEAHPAG